MGPDPAQPEHTMVAHTHLPYFLRYDIFHLLTVQSRFKQAAVV